MGDPDQPRDRIGRWTTGGTVFSSARTAVERLRAADLKSFITEERVRTAVTMALQNALARMSHVDDPIADAYIEHQVQMLSDHLKVTRANARNLMIAAIRKARELRK